MAHSAGFSVTSKAGNNILEITDTQEPTEPPTPQSPTKGNGKETAGTKSLKETAGTDERAAFSEMKLYDVKLGRSALQLQVGSMALQVRKQQYMPAIDRSLTGWIYGAAAVQGWETCREYPVQGYGWVAGCR